MSAKDVHLTTIASNLLLWILCANAVSGAAALEYDFAKTNTTAGWLPRSKEVTVSLEDGALKSVGKAGVYTKLHGEIGKTYLISDYSPNTDS